MTKISTTGIAFIHNPLEAWKKQGMPDRPGETFLRDDLPWPGRVERKKKRRKKKHESSSKP